MNYSKYNEEILKKERHEFYKLYKEKKKKSEIIEDVYSKQSKTGEQVLFINKDKNDYRLNSLYNPKEEAKKWAKQFKFNDIQKIVIMFGLGNGIFARSVIEEMEEDGILVIYEPSLPIFLHVMEEYDISDILQNTKVDLVIKGINENYLAHALDILFDVNNYMTHLILYHPFYGELCMEEYKNLTQKVYDAIYARKLDTNYFSRFGKITCENILRNLAYIETDYLLDDLFKSISKEIPVIVVAAGPSLEKNIHELKRAKGRAIIIAVTRVLDFLYQHDIEPDFLAILDPQEAVEEFSYGSKSIEFPLFCRITASTGMLNHHNGVKILTAGNEFVDKLLKKINKKMLNVMVGGSVATFAFGIAMQMEFKNIILIGQDLAYAKDGITHAGGIRETRDKDSTYTVEGIDGEPVEVRYDWYRFLRWYEEHIETKADTVTVYDATEGGAKIKGSIIKPLAECIDELCVHEINCGEILRSAKRGLDLEEKKQFRRLLDIALEDMDRIYVSSREMLKYCKKIIKLCNNNIEVYADNPMVHRIIKGNKKIMEYPIYSLLDFLVQESTKEIYLMTGDKLQDQKSTYLQSKLFYEKLMDACNEMKPILKQVITKLNESTITSR